MTRLRCLLVAAVAPAVGLFAVGGVAAQRPAVALINESPSLPRGVYVRACPSSKHLAQVWRGVNGERASSGVGF